MFQSVANNLQENLFPENSLVLIKSFINVNVCLYYVVNDCRYYLEFIDKQINSLETKYKFTNQDSKKINLPFYDAIKIIVDLEKSFNYLNFNIEVQK